MVRREARELENNHHGYPRSNENPKSNCGENGITEDCAKTNKGQHHEEDAGKYAHHAVDFIQHNCMIKWLIMSRVEEE